jgi:hypothetical protein
MIFVPVIVGIAGFVALMYAMTRSTSISPLQRIPVYLLTAGAAFALTSLHTGLAVWCTPVVFWVAFCVIVGLQRRAIAGWKREAAVHAIVLDAPFVGTWKAVVGGADRRRNHHLVASDQRFAYDFVREDGGSFGTPMLAPLSGTVSFVRDGMPDKTEQRSVHETSLEESLGNLQLGSVSVEIGERVESGRCIGLCGNSGRTSGSHLHIHAQRESKPDPFRATGVPIAFRVAGIARVLSADDVLTGPSEARSAETPVIVGR